MAKFEIIWLSALFAIAIVFAALGGGRADDLATAKRMCFEQDNLAACDYYEENR